MNQEVVVGTCDGTGAAINVCLGFIPRYCKVWNMEDAGNLEPVLEWTDQMALITQMAEGIIDVGISDADFDRSVLADTDGGIDAYEGGDEIVYDGVTDNQWEDSGGTVKEEVYVDGHYRRTAATDAAYKCIGDSIIGDNPNDGDKVKTPPGFTIGANANLNVNGEQICWVAFR